MAENWSYITPGGESAAEHLHDAAGVGESGWAVGGGDHSGAGVGGEPQLPEDPLRVARVLVGGRLLADTSRDRVGEAVAAVTAQLQQALTPPVVVRGGGEPWRRGVPG